MGDLVLVPDVIDRKEILEGDDRISLSRRVEVHDDTHVELKLDYGLPLRGRKVDYRVEIHAYFPGSLDLHAKTYSRGDFYQDLQAHLRFKTPDLSVEDLLSTSLDVSPLARLLRLRQTLEDGLEDPYETGSQAIEEAKLFGCLVRAYLRDKLVRLLPFLHLRLQDEAGFYDRERLLDSARRFDGKARALLHAFRSVHERYQSGRIELPNRVRLCLEQVDEFLSFQYEKTFCRLLLTAEGTDPLLAEELREPLMEGLRQERAHREARGYHPGPDMDDPEGNETFTHRMQLLKKFVGSALYLDVRRLVPHEVYSDWIGALAAGLAMLFATVSMILLGAQPASLANYSVIVGVVVVYIFKDRIKEVVKRRFTHDGLGWFSDLDSKIIDARRNVTLGRCRETTRWVSQGDIPALVERIRSFRSYTHRELRRSTGETILRYDKVVTLFPEWIHRAHNRRGDLNDIIRIDMGRFRRHMDNPVMPMLTLSADGERVVPVTGHKTYSVNLVLRYALAGEESKYEKIRVILDRDGIKRVETVIPPCSEGDLKKLRSKKAVEHWIRAHHDL